MLETFRERSDNGGIFSVSETFNAHYETIPFAYEWTIENLQFTREMCMLTSPDFSPTNGKSFVFSLNMCVNEKLDQMSLYVRVISCPTNSVVINCKFSILDQEGNKSNTKSKCYDLFVVR